MWLKTNSYLSLKASNMPHQKDRSVFLRFVIMFLMVLVGGAIAPIGYVVGLLFSVIGVICLFNVTEAYQLLLSGMAALVGLLVLFVRIRKDIADIRS